MSIPRLESERKKVVAWLLVAVVVSTASAGLAAAAHDPAFNVETGDAVFVSDRVVTVEANVTNLGNGSSATVEVEYRESGTNVWNSTQNKTTSETGLLYFNLTDLDPGTEYEYRAVAESDIGSLDNGSIRHVTTDAPPAVSTTGATDIGETSATLNGNLTDLGGASSASVGFEYRQVGSTTWLATDGAQMTSTGPYSVQVSDLDSGTDYEFRAVVDADDGDTATGDVLQFATTVANSPPSVDSLSATEDNPRNPHAEITVDWQVSDVDGDLATVEVSVADSSGQVVRIDRTTVSGSTASGSLYEEVKHGGRQTYTVSVVVTDAAGQNASAETTVDT